jgi:hypothetical protein
MATTLLLTWAEPGMVTRVLLINLTGRTKNKLITEKYGFLKAGFCSCAASSHLQTPEDHLYSLPEAIAACKAATVLSSRCGEHWLLTAQFPQLCGLTM